MSFTRRNEQPVVYDMQPANPNRGAFLSRLAIVLAVLGVLCAAMSMRMANATSQFHSDASLVWGFLAFCLLAVGSVLAVLKFVFTGRL